MSKVAITDRTLGVFRVEVAFSHEECDRLPFNALRSVRAVIEPLEIGGLRAIADFNLRQPAEAEAFLSWLLRFGAGGVGAAATAPPSPAAGVAAAPSAGFGYAPPPPAPVPPATDDDLVLETPPTFSRNRR